MKAAEKRYGNDKFNKIINQANITITGNNNRISMYFDTEESAEELLLSNVSANRKRR